MLYKPTHAHTSQLVQKKVQFFWMWSVFFSCMCEIKAVVEDSDISVFWESVGAWVVPPCWALASAPGWAAPEEAGKNGNLRAPREEPQTGPHKWTGSLVLKRDTERQNERERLTRLADKRSAQPGFPASHKTVEDKNRSYLVWEDFQFAKLLCSVLGLWQIGWRSEFVAERLKIQTL